MVGIAQLVRALDCGSRGRRFESDYPPHLKYNTRSGQASRIINNGVSPSGKATDFDSVISLVRIQPSQPIYKLQFCFRIVLIYLNYEPLAQLAEHLTFNQGVRGSNPRWLTKTVNPNLSRLAMGSDLLFLQFEKGEKSRLKDKRGKIPNKGTLPRFFFAVSGFKIIR